MIRPRLSEEEIVGKARLLPAPEVAPGDLRLARLEEWSCRCAALAIPDTASFVLWPDMALGFVVRAPTEAICRERLIVEYRLARDALERLALDFFYRFDRSQPQ